MSFPPRGKGRGSRNRGTEEEYVLFLQGIPPRCRWQELKDLVRQTALHIRQAVVYDDHHGFPTGLGQIIVKEEDEAWRTYHRLSTNGWEGQSLVVTLARTSAPTRPIAGPTKSPCIIQPGYVTGYSPPPRMARNSAIPPSPVPTEPVVPSSPTYHSADYSGMVNPIYVSHQTYVPVFTDPLYQAVSGVPNSPTLQPSFCDPMVFGLIPPYAMSHQMHPPVIANSFRQSHPGTAPGKGMHSYNAYSSTSPSYPCQNLRRSILIQNLNPTTTEHDLLDFLQESVAIEKCEILPPHTISNSQTTRNRLTARVTLRSAEDAKRVVALYNNTIFMRFRIRVKVDKSTPHTFSYDLAPDQYHSNAAELPTSVGRAAQLQFTPSQTETLSSDSDEQTRESESPQCKVTDPCPEAKPKSKPVDICRPLVVNGSGVGGRTAVAI
ncbi:RNA-binding protein [Aspergillus foveolatus]|uniref:RNA-binding protein n=1 Tax=Aspergillus foveolatus TaxID=210207 RepID=UPI003CCDCB9C